MVSHVGMRNGNHSLIISIQWQYQDWELNENLWYLMRYEKPELLSQRVLL